MDERAALAHAADENERRRWDCSLYPKQASSPYVLPWRPGEEYLVWRTTEHFVRGNGGVGLYAIDFQMRIGTTVVAARAGVVVATRDHFADGNGRDLEENYIFVRHDDGTIARYMHLTREGVMVAEGQSVAQRELLGLSGNTGQSAGPHLHRRAAMRAESSAGLQPAPMRTDASRDVPQHVAARVRSSARQELPRARVTPPDPTT